MISANRCLQPPADSYVEQGATLYCRLNCLTRAEQVTVTYRFVELETGTVHQDSVTYVIPLGPNIVTGCDFDVKTNMPECFLLSVYVTCSVATSRGQTYVRVKLRSKGRTDTMTFIRGYVTITEGLAYPPVCLQDSLSGMGHPLVATHQQDLGWPYKFRPTGRRLWRVRSIWFSYVSSAVGADRMMCLQLNDVFGNHYQNIISHVLQPPDTSFEYLFLAGSHSSDLILPGTPDVHYVKTGIGELILIGGGRLMVTATGSDAGDVPADRAWISYDEWLMPDFEVVFNPF